MTNKQKKVACVINPHAPEKVKKLKASGATSVSVGLHPTKAKRGAATTPMRDALRSAMTGASVKAAHRMNKDAVRFSQPSKSEYEQLELKLVPAASGSAFMVPVTKGGKEPTLKQRVAMAKHVQENANKGHYVMKQQRSATQPQPESEEDMKRKQAANEQLVQAADNAHLFHSSNAGLKPEEVKKKYEADAKATKRAKGKQPPAPPVAPARVAAQPKATKQPKGAATPAPRGRPRKGLPEGTKFRFVKDPTKTGMSKVFMNKAAHLKQFTKAQLVAATKKELETEDRAGKFFDYFVTKGALAPVKS